MTWNSEAWAPFWTLFAVKLSCTYRSLVPLGRPIVTVFPVAGFHVYVAEPTSVDQVLSFVLPSTDSVCVLVDHALDGGRSTTTEPIDWVLPRSTVRVVGQAPLVPSQ